VKLRKNASDTCAVLSEAYGGEAMKKSHVFEWHKWFTEGFENVENDERCGCPSLTEPVKMLKKYGIWCIQMDI
jgi:hypothetical protein